MRKRLLLGGLVTALAASFAPPTVASQTEDCDLVCRVVETTRIFFCIRDLTCDAAQVAG